MKIRNISFLGLLLACFVSLAGAEKFPDGTHVTVRVGNTLSSGSAHKGEVWEGTLTRDIVVRGKSDGKSRGQGERKGLLRKTQRTSACSG